MITDFKEVRSYFLYHHLNFCLLIAYSVDCFYMKTWISERLWFESCGFTKIYKYNPFSCNLFSIMHLFLISSIGLEFSVSGRTGTHDKAADLEAAIYTWPFFSSMFWNILFNHHGFQCIHIWVMVLHDFLQGRLMK